MIHFKFVPFLIRQKVCIDRARMYVGYASFPTTVAIALKVFGVHVTPLMIAIGVPIVLLIMVLFGRLELRLGAFQEEASRHSYLNPYNQEILNRLKSIEEKLTADREGACFLSEIMTIHREVKEMQNQLNSISEKQTRLIRLHQK